LDSRRKLLTDFEPSEESLRLVSFLKQRMPLIAGEIEVRHMVKAIKSYEWRGFKEKDLAMGLLMEAWRRMDQTQDFDLTTKKDLSEFVLEVVLEIGYPSQHLHLAQFEKNLFRSFATLTAAALDSKHLQFTEAWTVLSSGMSSLGTDEARPRTLFNLVVAGLERSEIRSCKIFQFRVMDIICFVPGKMEGIQDSELSSLISQTIRQVGSEQMEADLMVTWLDRIQWVQQSLSRSLIVDPKDVSFLLKIIDAIEVRRYRKLGFLRSRLSAVASNNHSDQGLG